MISRRGFVAGVCCLAAPGAAFAHARRQSFICGTADVDASDNGIQAPAVYPSAFPQVRATPDRGKLWKAWDGSTPDTGLITLNICFLNGSGSDKNAVRRIAPQWTQGRLGRRIALRFDARPEDSQIRILFRTGNCSLSSVGIDCKIKPKNEATMLLTVVSQRDILHEFGHALGLRHEHQHPNSGIVWNKPFILKDMKQWLNWSPAQVEANIFQHFSKDYACIGDPKSDPESIMLYQYPPQWTLDGRGTKLNTTISRRDRQCLEREYQA